MKKHNLAFIDLETTGLDLERHEIIEIACLTVKQDWSQREPVFTVLNEFDVKVKPKHIETAEPEALRITRYAEADWLFAVELPQALKELAERTTDAIMVGQNVAFDWGFLRHGFKETGVQNKMYFHRLDLIPMVFIKCCRDPKLERYNLGELSRYFGVANDRAHSAMSDIRATFEIYKKLIALP